jgi:hypothetical protein
MVVGRILVNGSDAGSGFAFNGKLALTANHVVRGQEAKYLQFTSTDGRNFQVQRVEGDCDLDVAALHLCEEVPEVLAIAHAREKVAWEVDCQPRGNDPKLTGTISAVHMPFENAQLRKTYVLQLLVEQSLGDYEGYSGSPVVLRGRTDGVLGILVEQQRWRLRGPIGERPRASNVLYAIPIEAVLDRFGLDVTSLRIVEEQEPKPEKPALEFSNDLFLPTVQKQYGEWVRYVQVLPRCLNEDGVEKCGARLLRVMALRNDNWECLSDEPFELTWASNDKTECDLFPGVAQRLNVAWVSRTYGFIAGVDLKICFDPRYIWNIDGPIRFDVRVLSVHCSPADISIEATIVQRGTGNTAPEIKAVLRHADVLVDTHVHYV